MTMGAALNGLLLLSVLVGAVLCCQPPDCDTPDCGSCGMQDHLYLHHSLHIAQYRGREFAWRKWPVRHARLIMCYYNGIG